MPVAHRSSSEKTKRPGICSGRFVCAFDSAFRLAFGSLNDRE